jgi:hypothetical protein
MGPCSIKMYDKAGLILRIETTTNDPSGLFDKFLNIFLAMASLHGCGGGCHD